MTEIKKEETKITVITNNGVKQRKIRINLRTFNKMVFMLIVIACFAYIAGANGLTAKGFKLRDMKLKAKETENENQALEARITDLSSYAGLGARMESLGMVKVDKITYIEVKDGSVAKK